MSLSLPLKDLAEESSLFRNRVLIAALGIALLTLALCARLVYLQFVSHEHYQNLSHNNRVNILPLAPTRGLIFDRNGVVLAQNVPSYSLEVVPEAVADMDALLNELREIVAIREIDEQRFRKALKRKKSFQGVPLRFLLSEREVANFAVNRHRFPGVDIQARLSRDYPLGTLAAHLVGYVGRISEADVARLDAVAYRGTSHIGKIGIERSYEGLLHGGPGYQQVESNAAGRTLRVLERTPPRPGNDLYLHLDAPLQALAEQALSGLRGAVVAIDPNTGGILALVSAPSYDPNLFVNGIEAARYGALRDSPARPLFNRAVNGQYPPGSTLKPFIALAALEVRLKQAGKKIFCPGWYQLSKGGRKYRDWKKRGHGHVSMTEALAQSCDVYFYELARTLGIQRMHDFLVRFGFGEKTGIDLPAEAAGLMPSPRWKRKARGKPWYPGETLITGIGQGFVLTTPLQLALATATLARSGERVVPRIVARAHHLAVDEETIFLAVRQPAITMQREKNWRRVIHGMVQVVHGPRGTARRSGLGARYRFAGKTGTAQVFGLRQEEEYKEKEVAKHLRDHALFIAFAPVKNPRIAIAVVVENGGSGSHSAAPVARRLLDQYLGQGAGQEKLASVASGAG